jgi:hypothetical protein
MTSSAIGGAPGQLAEDADKNRKGRLGVDARWEDNIVVIDAQGSITERWTQWDSMIKRPRRLPQSVRPGKTRVGGRRLQPLFLWRL